jgi:hypothetical protein
MPASPSPSRPWWLLAPASLPPWWWLAVAALFVGADYVLGVTVDFTPAFVIPVTMAAWYSGRTSALALASGLPLSHAVLALTLTGSQWPASAIVQNAATSMVILSFLALGFTRFAEHERRLERQIRVLEGLLPICSVCKNIRDPHGHWQKLEHFIQDRSEAKFSHGLCPRCVEHQYEGRPARVSAEEAARRATATAEPPDS